MDPVAAIDAAWRRRCREDELLLRTMGPPVDSELPAALAEAADGGDVRGDRIGREARRLVTADTSVLEAMRQLSVLAVAAAEQLPPEQGAGLIRGLGFAFEAIGVAYVSSAEKVAQTDRLTGLPNMRVLDRDLEMAVARVEASGGSTAIALLDLDGLKVANDDFGGHFAGNHYIKRFGAELAAAAHELQGRAYRLHDGGDEFCVLLNDCSRDAAEAALERLVDRADVAPFCYGVAACPDDGLDAPALMFIADKERLYAMKESRPREERAASARAWLESDHWDFEPGSAANG